MNNIFYICKLFICILFLLCSFACADVRPERIYSERGSTSTSCMELHLFGDGRVKQNIQIEACKRSESGYYSDNGNRIEMIFPMIKIYLRYYEYHGERVLVWEETMDSLLTLDAAAQEKYFRETPYFVKVTSSAFIDTNH